MNSLRFWPAIWLLLAGLPTAWAGTIVPFHTSLGDIQVELYDADKPVTVQNFLTYVQGGHYDNMFMHRVETNGIAVVQGGAWNIPGLGTSSPRLAQVPTLPPITNEFNVGAFYSNLYGTIAMAKTSDPNSANSQFFFNLADNSTALDDTNNSGGFTVFGHVVAGTEVLNQFLVGPTNLVVKEVDLSVVDRSLAEMPVRYSANPSNGITFADPIYVYIGLPYTPLKASYNGLSAAPASPAQGVPGSITLTTTAASALSGSLRLGTARYTFSGLFDTAGHANLIARSGSLAPLTLSLYMDPFLGSDKLLGTLSATNWTAEVSAYRAGFDGRTTLATNYSGKYTLAATNSSTGGTGVAALSVTTAGRVNVSGSLADGTAFTQSVAVSADGHWPLFAPLIGGKGSFSAWMSFTNRAQDDVNGAGLWYKPAQPTAKAYITGFTNNTALSGLRYTPPTIGTAVLSLPNYQVTFSGAGLSGTFTNGLRLKSNQLLNTSTNRLTLALSLSSGLFSGSVKPPGSALSIPFKGTLFQGQNSGSGYFLSSGQSGQLWLHE